MSIDKININDKFKSIDDHWYPRIAGELNGQYIKLVKFIGEFVWYKHDLEDEMFLVAEGNFTMELRDKTVELSKGDFIIIPKGVEHRPVARQEAHVLLFEPACTLNTGDAISELTREKLEKI